MLHHSLLTTELDKNIFIDAVFANMGISTALVLTQIAYELPIKADCGLSATALSKKCQLTPGGMIYHLNRLSLKGYVVRKGHREWIAGDELKKLRSPMKDGQDGILPN